MKQRPSGKPKGMMSASTACIIAGMAFCAGLLIGSLDVFRTGESAVHEEEDNHITQALLSTASNPRDAEAWVHLGNLYFDADRPVEAIPAYEKALELVPGNPDVMTDLGTMYRMVGNSANALEIFDAAMGINPDHFQSHFNKGLVLLFDQGRPAEGVAVWREYLSRHPDAAVQGRPLIGEIAGLAANAVAALVTQGNDQAALAAFEQALLADPGHVSALRQKAALLEKLARQEEGKPGENT